MAEYLKVYADDGYLQIDDNTPNYHLVSNQTLANYTYITSYNWSYSTTCAGNGSFLANIYELGYNGTDDDLFYIHNPLSKAVQVFTNITQPLKYVGTDWYYGTDGRYVAIVGCTKAEADTIRVLKYSKTYANTNSGVGLQCFNAQGEKVFSSDSIPLKIVSFQQQTHTTASNVYFSGSWSFSATSESFSFPIGAWLSLRGAGGANTTASQTKNTFIYLSSNSYTLGYFTSWSNEYDNIKNKTEYRFAIAQTPCPYTMYTIANVNGLV